MKNKLLPIAGVLLFGLEAGALHYYLFAGAGAFAAWLVAFEACLLWGFIFTCRRSLVMAALTVQFLLSLVLISWHHYFDDALSLQVIGSQFGEGVHFAKVALGRLMSGKIWAVLLVWAAQMAILFKWYRPLPKAATLRLTIGIPLLVMFALISKGFYKEIFSFNDFKLYTRNFGYATGWYYELMTNLQQQALLDDIIENANQPTPPLPPELAGMKLPAHVYVVQIESLDYAGYEKPGAMPFLNELAEQSLVYEIRAKRRYQSANADFMTVSKANNFQDYYFAIYTMLPAADYDKLPLLTKQAGKLGYHHAFYHGFSANFYQRGDGCRNMKFDQCWFWDNLPIKEKNGDWGVEDGDLFKFVLENEQKTAKSLSMIVTVSSHEDFNIGLINRQPYANPASELEKYYNALNYVDKAFKELITNAPKDSLFILYSDHHSGMHQDTRTLFYVYNKAAPRAFKGVIDFERIPQIIHGLFEQESQR